MKAREEKMTRAHLSKFTAIYLQKFFAKKNLPVEEWQIEVNGQIRTIKNTDIIEQILAASPAEQSVLAEALQELDTNNHDVNTFLKHLAIGSRRH